MVVSSFVCSVWFGLIGLQSFCLCSCFVLFLLDWFGLFVLFGFVLAQPAQLFVLFSLDWDIVGLFVWLSPATRIIPRGPGYNANNNSSSTYLKLTY